MFQIFPIQYSFIIVFTILKQNTVIIIHTPVVVKSNLIEIYASTEMFENPAPAEQLPKDLVS